MPFERIGYITNDPRNNLCTITKDNDFSKLKSFLRHDHFACKLAPIKFPIAWKISLITRFTKQHEKKNNLHFTLFDSCVQFFGLEACSSVSFHTFLYSFPSLF
jgi:hypothetical protein